MSEKLEFKVEEANAGMRLDLFLAISQNQLSRSAIRKILDNGNIKLNGQIEYRPNYKVKQDDLIVVKFDSHEPVEEIVPQKIDIDIVYEDEHVIAINKPINMVVHPATGNWQDTMMNAVQYHFQEQKNVGDKLRSGLIHRIDKDTSGLVLVGKTNKGLWFYTKQFAERKVHKTYALVVRGNVSEKYPLGKFTVRNFLGRSSKNRKKITQRSPQDGKHSETTFEVQDHLTVNNIACTYLYAFPKTGRTHQIRVHITGEGYPILGDVIYGRNNDYKRLMLHAYKLELPKLGGGKLELSAKLPKDFTEII